MPFGGYFRVFDFVFGEKNCGNFSNKPFLRYTAINYEGYLKMGLNYAHFIEIPQYEQYRTKRRIACVFALHKLENFAIKFVFAEFLVRLLMKWFGFGACNFRFVFSKFA